MQAAETIRQERMAILMQELATDEGDTESLLDGITLFRVSASRRKYAVMSCPGVTIIGQGSKTCSVGDQVCTCDAHNYLVMSVPLPLECEVHASPENPVLGLLVRVTPAILGELLVAMNGKVPLSNAMPKGIASLPLSEALSDAVIRLLECLQSPEDSLILGRQYSREIIYHVLRGEQGGALQSLVTQYSHFNVMAGILTRMHMEYATPLNVQTLARESGMSLSAFYRSFKAITSTSPLQYLKSIRLHKARTLMVQAGLHAGTAAGEVGYQSASQFSREFKRFFGNSPAEEAAKMRESLSLSYSATGYVEP